MPNTSTPDSYIPTLPTDITRDQFPRVLLEALQHLAAGDFSLRLPTHLPGHEGAIAEELNRHLDQMQRFTDEQLRIQSEIGSGKFGGQMLVPGIAGRWLHVQMATNRAAATLCDQVRRIDQAIAALAAGDLTHDLQVPAAGETQLLRDRLRDLTAMLRGLKSELVRLSQDVNVNGNLGQQAHLPGVTGEWAELVTALNATFARLTEVLRNIGAATVAFTDGRPYPITFDARGELAELKDVLQRLSDRFGPQRP